MKYLLCSFALALSLIGEWDQRAISAWHLSPQSGCHISQPITLCATAPAECALPVPEFFTPLLLASESVVLVDSISAYTPATIGGD
jgi:hypothetical protein